MSFDIVNSTAKAGGNADNVTTPPISTIGSNLIVVAVGRYYSGGLTTFVDSLGNYYFTLNNYNDSSVVDIKLYWCFNPITDVSHQFQALGTADFPCLAVLAINHYATFNGQNGFANDFSTIQPGSITPTADNAIVISGCMVNSPSEVFGIDAPFEIAAQALGDVTNGNSIAIAYDIQTAAATRNPTWNTGFKAATSIVAFLPDESHNTPFVTTMFAKRV